MPSTKRNQNRASGGWANIRKVLDLPVIKFVVAFMTAIFDAKVEPEQMAAWAANECRERLRGAVAIFCAMMNGVEYVVKSAEKAAEPICRYIVLTAEVECNFDKGLATMVEEIKRALGLTYVNSDIFKIEWPWKGLQKLDMALFHFDRDMKTEDAEREMETAGYRPATLAELLFFGLLHPDLFLKYPLVALGSVFDGYSPCLFDWSDVDRSLSLFDRQGRWYRLCRFLGVRK